MLTPVVVCGSFHRDRPGLRRLIRELEATHCRVLSPLSIDFGDSEAGFVRTASEAQLSDDEIERFHLRAMRDARLVWLHAPGGYVGISAAFELGHAAALGIPVFGFETPDDAVLRSQVRVVRSVFEALDVAGSA